MPSKTRRIQLPQRQHRRLPHVIILVLEHDDESRRVRRQDRRLQHPQRIHRNLPHAHIIVLKHSDKRHRVGL